MRPWTGRLLPLPLLLFLLLLAAALPLAADSYPRPVGYVVTHYSFAVTLSDLNNQVAVVDTVEGHFTQDGVQQLRLDLCQLRTAPEPADRSNPCLLRPPYGVRAAAAAPAAVSSVGRGMQVTSVSAADGDGLSFQQAHDQLLVAWPAGARAGASFRFTVAYHGVPANGLLIGHNKYGDRGFFTNEWPDLARNWLAVVDHPAMKATKQIAVTAPRQYQVISNGVERESTDLAGGLRRTVWQEAVPICTWQFSLAVAPMAVDDFGQFHHIPLSAWVFPQERAAGFAGFSQYTQPILEFYIDHIGPFSYEKLAQVEANGVGGGMELASDIFYGYPPSGPGRQLIAHEMAHQWFGDSVTESDWDDVWLSEGFATYFALLYTEHQDGRDAFLAGVESSAASARRYVAQHPGSPLVHQDLQDISQVIANNAQIYQEGAQVLHMLRGVVGTPTFWSGIRLYYQRYRNANASSLDFQHALEDACAADATCPAAGRDLSWFFNEWLHRGGLLQVSGSWRYDARQKQLVVSLDQAPNPAGPYQMPFQIGITLPPPLPPPIAAAAAPGGRGRGGRGGRGRSGRPPAAAAAAPVLWLKGAHAELRLPLAQAPLQVTLDPEHWVTMATIAFQPH